MRPEESHALEAELTVIRADRPVVTADEIVRWADRNRDSAWGHKLDWDDQRAAHSWRVHQVRHILAIELKRDDHTPFVVSLSFDRKAPHGGYRDFEDVSRSPNLMGILLRDVFNELERLRSKYSFLKEFAGVWEAIDASADRRKEVESERTPAPAA